MHSYAIISVNKKSLELLIRNTIKESCWKPIIFLVLNFFFFSWSQKYSTFLMSACSHRGMRPALVEVWVAGLARGAWTPLAVRAAPIPSLLPHLCPLGSEGPFVSLIPSAWEIHYLMILQVFSFLDETRRILKKNSSEEKCIRMSRQNVFAF